MRKLVHKLVARAAIALSFVAFGFGAIAAAEEPISFVLPAASFQPIAADAYPTDNTPPEPPIPTESLTPPPSPPTPNEMVSPGATDTESYMTAEAYESLDCPTGNGYGGNGGCLPPGRLPNGQYPDDWMWGCGGWPYANGPGMCDDWKVGCRWHVQVDGLILSREDADLDALFDATDTNSAGGAAGRPQVFDQFDYSAGGRVFFTSEIPHRAGYQIQAGWEGIPEWNSSIVYPKFSPYPAGPTNSSEQRSVFYTSSLNSAELNFMRGDCTGLRPFCGVRYIKFDDEINDSINQDVPPPLPSPAPSFSVTETDRVNIMDIENNLIGFQIGTRYDLWRPTRRCLVEGYINAGVYYNRIKRTNLMTVTTTQFTSEDTDMVGSEARTDVSQTSNLDISEPTDVAATGEASLTGVFYLNRCWALRAGYQFLWIDGVSLAEDAFLDNGIDERSLIFQGCHVGIECRR